MSSSLSKLVDNLSEGIHIINCANCKSNLDYIKTKNEKLILECIKQYELDPAHFLSLAPSLPRLAWQACLKKTNIELELLNDYDMLLMVEEGMRGGICHSIHRYGKASHEYMKNDNNNEESSYIIYMVGQCLKNYQ